MRLKIWIMTLAVGVFALLSAVEAEAAGPTCATEGVPIMAVTKADAHQHRHSSQLKWVRAEWYGVSAATHYRMEATPQGGGRTISDTDTPSYSGGKNMDTVRVRGSVLKAHDVRILALDGNGDTIACGYRTGRLYTP